LGILDKKFLTRSLKSEANFHLGQQAMTTIYLALGSNVGNLEANVKKAVDLLRSKLHDLIEAPKYISKAVDYTNQPDFINTAVQAKTDLVPEELLKFIDEVEDKVGRIKRFRWGPREIDIDIIFYGDQVYRSSDLVIPHPRFRERDFVLQPLVDLSSDLIDPMSEQTVKQLLDKLDAQQLSIIRRV
jgi:2-amino-4-hydroxy-6-hydroxymethyldihydropteridine diphosphokinase